MKSFSHFLLAILGVSVFLGCTKELEPEDDAATVILGAGWKTPIHDEFEELLVIFTLTYNCFEK